VISTNDARVIRISAFGHVIPQRYTFLASAVSAGVQTMLSEIQGLQLKWARVALASSVDTLKWIIDEASELMSLQIQDQRQQPTPRQSGQAKTQG